MDESPLQLISEIGRHLGQRSRPTKDLIVKSLRQAVSALSQLEQFPILETTTEVQAAKKRETTKKREEAARKQEEALKRREAALQPLANTIIRGLLQHADKDVRLLVAICVTEIFRVRAPVPPFEDKYLRDVFKLIISAFEDLADTSSPLFSKRVKILDTVARLKCCVIMLDIDCGDLVLEMFSIFFSVVRNNHHASSIAAMCSIMIDILNAGGSQSSTTIDNLNEGASQQLLEVILQNLIRGEKDATCAASQLAASVIKTCADENELKLLVCRFLTSCINERDAVRCKLKEYYHEIIFKIFQCAPQMLIAVIPSLIEELLADQVDVRIKAVNLVGKLFALPNHNVAQKYHDLFAEFLKRFSDKSVDVRISALQCAKAFYMVNSYGTESHEIITAVEDRLLDFDDRVRMQAVLVACDLSRSNLKLVPSKLISQATERLRDKKISVRKRALQKLIEVYQDYCKKCSEGSMTISDHFEEIPCKIMMLCYDKDCKEFRSQNMELVLAGDLFPEHLSVEERTKHWIHMFSLFSSLHEKALNTILIQKTRLQNEMKNYLAFRKKLKEITSEETQKKTESMFMKMATSFPDPPKAVEWLHKLNQTKDNNVFKSLEQLLEEQTFATGQIIQDKLLKVIGDSHPYIEFLRLLFFKCSYNIFSSDHVHYILDFLSNIANGNKNLEGSSVKLLLAIVRATPSILKGLGEKFQMLLEQKSSVNDKLIEVLAKAGSYISAEVSNIYPFLERMCLDGTRTQAKFSVSAIAALSSENSVFSNLYEGLIDSLHSHWNVPTVLQSLGCIAQYSILTFETRGEEITSYISQKIIQVEPLIDGHNATSFDDTSVCGDSCHLKICGLKTLVKSFLPYRGNHVTRNISGLLDILLRMLRESDVSVNTDTCESDKAHIRLAAAKSILRLAKRWDLHITPEIFRFTILIGKDSSSSVRRSFLNKAQRMLKERRLPIKYACAFSLGMTDSIKDLQYYNIKCMEEFIKDYSMVARVRQASAVQGAIVDYPAYIVVFLVHVLAHDTGFLSEDCQDEEMHAEFYSPLFFVLQALVNPSIVDGDLDIVNEAILYLFSILRAIRIAEDAVDVQMTSKLHMLADFGIFILNAFNRGAISASQAPGQILLPSSLYRMRLAKNDAISKCPKSSFDECFLSRVFHKLKSYVSRACVQKPPKSLPKHGRNCQEDVPRSNNNSSELDLHFSKPADLSRRAMSDAKTARPDIPSGEKRKRAVSSTVSASVGLHECSTINKQQSFASRCCERPLERNQISSSDSASLKGARGESHVSTRKLKRAAASSTEDAVASSKNTVQSFKCPRKNFKDTCGSKKGRILADVSNKSHSQHCDPGEHSSLSSIKKITATATTGQATKTPLNQETGAANANRRGKSTETSASEVVNTNAEQLAIRRRRKV